MAVCVVQVASAFSHMLYLHNLSENVVSSRMVRTPAVLSVPATCNPQDIGGVLHRCLSVFVDRCSIMQHRNGEQLEEAFTMLKQSGKTPEELYKALTEQRVDLVFTAHPTQAMRGSVRKKYDKLFHDMTRMLDRPSNVSLAEVQADMYADIQVLPLLSLPSCLRATAVRRRRGCASPSHSHLVTRPQHPPCLPTFCYALRKSITPADGHPSHHPTMPNTP